MADPRPSDDRRPDQSAPPAEPSARRYRLIAPAVAVLLAVAATCLVAYAADSPGDASPFAGRRLFVDDTSAAHIAASASANPTETALLRRMAQQPQAVWLGDWQPTQTVGSDVSDVLRRAEATQSVPLLVLYAIPHRDCGGRYSAGGFGSAALYTAWVDAVAGALGDHRAFVIVEPDALAQLTCLPEPAQTERYALLRHVVDALARHPNVVTYLDAGHSRWIDASDMADRLRLAGVARARGFALNVSFFSPTPDENAYGGKISGRIGHKPFVIDTSRNGVALGADATQWCNPPGRALGVPPLTPPRAPLVDALLWVKAPGVSDGDCGRGEPAAGVFWPGYAWGLAERAGW